VPEDTGVEPPAVSPVSTKRKKAGRRSSGIRRYFSDMPTGMLAKYNLACRFAPIFAILKLNFRQKVWDLSFIFYAF
jgi:hypothetical protein